jgi:hypothetical protein
MDVMELATYTIRTFQIQRVRDNTDFSCSSSVLAEKLIVFLIVLKLLRGKIFAMHLAFHACIVYRPDDFLCDVQLSISLSWIISPLRSSLLEFFNFICEVSRLQYEWSSDCWCIWKSSRVNACLQWKTYIFQGSPALVNTRKIIHGAWSIAPVKKHFKKKWRPKPFYSLPIAKKYAFKFHQMYR